MSIPLKKGLSFFISINTKVDSHKLPQYLYRQGFIFAVNMAKKNTSLSVEDKVSKTELQTEEAFENLGAWRCCISSEPSRQMQGFTASLTCLITI